MIEIGFFGGSKTVDQRSGANAKNCFLLKFAANFLLFYVFCIKNTENAYFDQRLACTAPKRWLKYTTQI